MAKTTKKVRKGPKKKFTDYKCTICSKTFTEKAGLNHHIQTHSSEKPYECDICSSSFKTKKYLSRHVKKVHNAATEHECSYCGRKFHYKSLLQQHLYIHTDERPYKCKFCGKGFNSSYTLNNHKNIHTDSKPFKCDFCDYACRDSSSMRKHRERHMGIKKRYQCTLCEKSYCSKTRLKLHVNQEHLNIEVKRMRCKECSKVFKSTASLNNHIKIVHKKAYACQCEICGVNISNRYNMSQHLAKHMNFRPFKCNFNHCTKRFKDMCSLKKHIIIHYPGKHFECDICNRKFSRLSRLKLHQNQHRQKKKCVFCDHCGKGFYNKNYLISHINKKHMLKQEFFCDECGFKTTNKPSMVMHIKSGHESEMDRQCKICNKIYKKHIYLKAHYWKTHCVRYNMTLRRKKPKKREIIIKEEPIEVIDREFLHEVKVEVDERVDSEEKPVVDFNEYFKELIVKPGSSLRKEKKDKNIKVDVKCQKEAKIYLKRIIETKKRKREMREMERTRREYNRRLKGVSQNKVATKIKFIRNINNNDKNESNDNGVNSNDVRNYININKYNDTSEEMIGNDINKESDKTSNDEYNDSKNINENIANNDRGFNNITEENEINESHEVNEEIIVVNKNNNKLTEDNDHIINSKDICDESDDKNENNDGNDEVNDHLNEINDVNMKVNKQDSKLKLNTHQCYVCFKLYENKEKLTTHCQEHFDICNINILKKCPLCDYVTKVHLKRHMLSVHKIKSKKWREMKLNATNNYNKTNNIEIIPSVKSLNKQAYVKLDREKREERERGLVKKSLVKQNGEWMIKNDISTDYNKYLIPKSVLKPGFKLITASNDYLGRLKKMYRVVRDNGGEMVFPCDKCDKICQTLSALKLHSRKHEINPKPFKKKTWKHKQSGKESEKQKEIGRNRYEKPKPIVNKHKCDDELKEFYNNNVKGGDIEFWQFLKIFNKISKENIRDFPDLKDRFEFGSHNFSGNMEKVEIGNMEVEKRVKKRCFKRTEVRRTILISKKEHERRKIIIESLRRKN